MIVNSIEQLKKIVQQKLSLALKMTQDEIYETIQENINKYYDEEVFYNIESNSMTNTPRFYNRTFQFLQSLIKTDVIINGMNVCCSVKIDTDSLNYIQDGETVIDMINRGYHADTSLNNGSYETPRNIYTKSHFWDDSLEQLGGYDGILSIMKNNCKKVGIPIK